MSAVDEDRGRAGELRADAAGTGGTADVSTSAGGADRLRDDEWAAGLAVPDLWVPDAEPVAPLPLGPGDDDPRSPAKVGEDTARPALGPGDLAGVDPHEGFTFVAPPAPGPGDSVTGPRYLTRVPKKES